MQVIHVGGNHWWTVFNVGCDNGVVDVYDSLCTSVSNVTVRVIASLVYSYSSNLVVRMMDVVYATSVITTITRGIAPSTQQVKVDHYS